MAKPLLMFTWSDVADALESFAETPQRRKAACRLLEQLKADSAVLSPDELLAEIINSAVLLGASAQPADGLLSLSEG